MNYILNLNDRPFKAIKAGTKKVEGRTMTSYDKTSYGKMKSQDRIVFTNNVTGEKLETEIVFIHHYRNVKEMLEKEGVENIMSSTPKTIENGIKNYNLFTGYKEGIKKNGIYAIGIKLLKK